MAYITQLTDINNETAYPRTVVGAITDSGGSSLSSILDNKVPRVPGKDLSTNDYTNAEKQKLEKAFTDLEATKQDVGTLKSDVSTLKSDVDTAKAEIIGLNADTKRVENEINEYNISAINNGEKYASLSAAISALNTYLGDSPKNVGTKITYVDSAANKAKTFSYQGGSFVNVESWSDEPLGGYNRKLFENIDGIHFNESTGFYEVYKDEGGLNDVTTEQMRVIYSETSHLQLATSFEKVLTSCHSRINIKRRTNEPTVNILDTDIVEIARNSRDIEVLMLPYYGKYGLYCRKNSLIVYNCVYLKRVNGILDISKGIQYENAFYGSYSLEYIHLKNVKESIRLAESSNLLVDDYTDEMKDVDLSSLAYLIKYAANETEISITLHHNAFIRVPQSLIDKATAKQIRIVDATPTV